VTLEEIFMASIYPLGVFLLVTLSLGTMGHAMIYKRDVRASIAWTAVIFTLPIVGAVLYMLFGVNRIRRQASARRADLMAYRARTGSADEHRIDPDRLDLDSPLNVQLMRLTEAVAETPLVAGNRIEPFASGTRAYEAMLEAIENARHSVGLSTYIFDHDHAGHDFAEALARAARRGVEVRVLIDAVGDRYSSPSMTRALRRAGVKNARFLPSRVPWRMPYLNLRNHRKILVVDGRTAFTGGMNIRQGHRVEQDPKNPVRDVHFRLMGPVVATLSEVFAEDWTFTTREVLSGEAWFPHLEPAGEVIARGIVDGPDEDLGRLWWALLGALACAKRRVRVMTPYFLPASALISALTVAARRGLEVEILLPAKGNLRFVQWASTALLWQVLEGGCKIYLTAPPFDHTKLMVIDDDWALIGSANWDPRSLRLNFELNVECYSRELVARLHRIVDERQRGAEEITLEDVNARPLPIQLRDAAARLLAPYL